jgi:hypothetical protein
MPKGTVTIEIDASCTTVFDLIHNYDRRLEWDTLLSEATLLREAKFADKGVQTRCVGTWRTGKVAMETEYITFELGRVAAVKLVNRPPLFEQFAATIRHKPIAPTRSSLTYIYSFRARPRWLAFILEPILHAALRRETKARLHSLKAYLERLK